jgi:ABC-type nitrate/sulfonate/bicarbonate transport system permease component
LDPRRVPPLGAPEFVGAEAGLGYMIPRRELSMDMAGVSAILVIPSIMGVGLQTRRG